MGADCHIRVVGEADLDWAQDEVARLEGLWTRFRPSELLALGAGPRRVDPDTRLLVERAVAGYDLTGGAFNPFLVDQILAAGYDRDFDELTPVPLGPAQPGVRAQVTIDGDVVSSSLPVDSGGIGKGLAADLVVQRLLNRGAKGVLVNLGGDVRCAGQAPADSWRIGIETPVPVARPLSVTLQDGAVCTSTPLLRRWQTADGAAAHHLLDPRTGRPAESDFASVTVIAREAWLAEVLSKAVFLLPTSRAGQLLGRHDAGAILVTLSGGVSQI
jgi:thiamine biosynthesis lipoprotein